MTPIETNKPVFFDTDGSPLEGGLIYIGQPSTDPRTSPKTVTFRDSGGSEFAASQPLKTNAGRIVYNGLPIVSLVDGEYSMLIINANGQQVDYSSSVNAEGASGGISDFSEVIRVGLTLSEIKTFAVSVGEVVRNIGGAVASDGLGSDWLVISASGTPSDDENLISFNNGLQGQRVGPPKHVVIYEAAGNGDVSVPLSNLDTLDQVSGQFAVKVNLFRANGSTFGEFWVALAVVSTTNQSSCAGGETASYKFSVFYSGSTFSVSGEDLTGVSTEDFRIKAISRVK